jgi:phosphatidate phosphatase PAH1
VSSVISLLTPHHRGRDGLFAPDAPQWVIGTFAYGPEKGLKGEDVDIFVLRDCAGSWENLGTATTTFAGEHDAVEGVEDSGGHIFFQIPDDKKLGIGRHRIQMVVAGDGSTAEQYIEVLPKGAPIFVSDVDGTLTEREPTDPKFVCDEESDFPALWRSIFEGTSQPLLHQGAPDAYATLVAHGFQPFYLTARPEWLVPHTRAFLDGATRGDGRGDLPQGLVHTTLSEIGALGSASESFKKAELQALRDKGFVPTFAFGNHQSDVAAYNAASVPFRFYYDNSSTTLRECSQVRDLPLVPRAAPLKGDWRIETYGDLAPVLANASSPCK